MCCVLLDVRGCLLFVVCTSVVCVLLRVVRCSLLVVRCLSFVVRCVVSVCLLHVIYRYICGLWFVLCVCSLSLFFFFVLVR